MSPARDLFREDALAASEAGQETGVALALVPTWMGAAYWVILGIAAAAFLLSLLARVGEYARGPAVVRALGRLDVITQTGGIVTAVEVVPGKPMQRGEILVRFNAENESRELDRIDREFDLKLVQILLHPTDEATRQSLASLRAQRELASARLNERQLSAPRSGVVRSLRIRPGQMLAPGDLVLTLVDEANAAFAVEALVPGQFRPMLKQGMTVRFALDGYPQVAATLSVDSIGDEAVGPNEVRRYFGQELGDTLPIQGSLVLVRAHLPDPTFRWRGRPYRFFDGIPGHIDVEVRTLSIFAMLFPAFDEL